MKRLAIFSCLVLQTGLLFAQAAPTDPGRLFFSAERRAALDRQRRLNIEEVRTVQGETLHLDGIVQRSSGKHTVWINGRPQTEAEQAKSGIGVRLSQQQTGRAMIHPGDEAAIPLAVGESINRSSGERDSRLGNGRVARHSRP